MKQDKRIEIYSHENPSLPENPKEFLVFFSNLFSQIPDEYKDKATVDIVADTFYDSAILELNVYYYRPETESEETERMERINQKGRIRKDRSVQDMMETAKKYGYSIELKE